MYITLLPIDEVAVNTDVDNSVVDCNNGKIAVPDSARHPAEFNGTTQNKHRV